MLRLAVFGAAGRMGQEVIRAIEKSRGIKIIGGVDAHSKNFLTSLTELGSENIDGVIDFSQPRGLIAAAKWCSEHSKFLVSGTTGLNASDIKSLKLYARRTPILWSPNMSIGIAVLRKSLEALKELKGFDFQIEEFHHRHKKDRPSGTALLLQKDLEKIVQPKVPPPLSIRGGGIKGIHRVWAMSEGETLCFEHTALERGVFADGALVAAQWLVRQKPGWYSLDDVLNSK